MSVIEIGLCPLALHPFNDCKSGLKALQYWANSSAVVCSDSPAYECVTDRYDGLKAGTASDWSDAIMTLVKDETLRKQLGANGRQTLVQKHDMRCRAEDWINVISGAVEARKQRV